MIFHRVLPIVLVLMTFYSGKAFSAPYGAKWYDVSEYLLGRVYFRFYFRFRQAINFIKMGLPEVDMKTLNTLQRLKFGFKVLTRLYKRSERENFLQANKRNKK